MRPAGKAEAGLCLLRAQQALAVPGGQQPCPAPGKGLQPGEGNCLQPSPRSRLIQLLTRWPQLCLASHQLYPAHGLGPYCSEGSVCPRVALLTEHHVGSSWESEIGLAWGIRAAPDTALGHAVALFGSDYRIPEWVRLKGFTVGLLGPHPGSNRVIPQHRCGLSSVKETPQPLWVICSIEWSLAKLSSSSCSGGASFSFCPCLHPIAGPPGAEPSACSEPPLQIFIQRLLRWHRWRWVQRLPEPAWARG